MDFIRRLFGIKPENFADTAPVKRANLPPVAPPAQPPASEVKPPETMVTPAPSIPTIQPPPPVAREIERDNDLTPNVAEAALLAAGTRQLPPIENIDVRPGKTGKHMTFGMSSDVGMIRSNNQDALFAMTAANVSSDSQPDFGIFVVADGMGGHHDGEKASAITARLVGKYLAEQFYLKLLAHSSKDNNSEPTPVISEVISEAVQEANKAVSTEIPEGGTTVTAAAIFGDLIYIGHVGDSRAYLITPDEIEQITRDHSLVQRLIELDQLTPEEAAIHPQRNVLYRAVGQTDNLEVDTITRRLPTGARILLCSDGLWNQIDKSTLMQIVMGARTPQEACDKLISVANERGGPDNITAILVHIPG